MRFRTIPGSTPKRPRRRLRFEPLEDRRVMACLAIGVTLDTAAPASNTACDANAQETPIEVGNVGDPFTLQVRVQDVRDPQETPAGVIALPVHLSWDPDFIELVNVPNTGQILLNDPLVTNSFPLQRFLDGVNENAPRFEPASPPDPDPTPNEFLPFANLQGLRGAALPNANQGMAIGLQGEDPFSTLQFRSKMAGQASFTIRLAGSMSFGDADPLDAVGTGSNLVKLDDITVQAQLQIDPAPSNLSGFVFADTDLDGVRDANEAGLPNVQLQLVRTDASNGAVETTLTGPDGWYHFEDVEPGLYDVIESQPAGFVNASISLGAVFPPAAQQPANSLRGSTDGFNAFRGVDLREGGNAVDFNFGENLIPTKRRFVASVDPFRETCAQLTLACVTVTGTTGDDQIELSPDTDVVGVTLNGQAAGEFARSDVDIVKIDALEGDDTVTLIGSSGDDVAHLQPNSCTIQTGDYQSDDYAALVVNAEEATADGRLGNDLAVFRDSEADDELTAMDNPFTGPVTELEWGLNLKQLARVVAFERTRAASIPRDGVNDTDTATLNGVPIELVGKWIVQP